MATPRFLCPLSLSVIPPATKIADASGKMPEDTTHGTICVGPQCHLWLREPEAQPLDGQCAFVIGAIGIASVAHLAQQAFNAGQAEGKPPAQS